MAAEIREFDRRDLMRMTEIWNEVVEEANAFPQREPLKGGESESFFAGQSFTGVAVVDGRIEGLYILHPNNVGRCGHLSNASYAVSSGARGRGIGRNLVEHSLETARRLGFRVMQFNAVVKSNAGAIHLYETLGFVRLGTVPGGFERKDGSFEDIVLFYHTL